LRLGKPGAIVPVLPLSLGAGNRFLFAHWPFARARSPSGVSTGPDWGALTKGAGKVVDALEERALKVASFSPDSLDSE